MIGLVIIFGAWAMISLLTSFFGVNLYELIIPDAQGRGSCV